MAQSKIIVMLTITLLSSCVDCGYIYNENSESEEYSHGMYIYTNKGIGEEIGYLYINVSYPYINAEITPIIEGANSIRRDTTKGGFHYIIDNFSDLVNVEEIALHIESKNLSIDTIIEYERELDCRLDWLKGH